MKIMNNILFYFLLAFILVVAYLIVESFIRLYKTKIEYEAEIKKVIVETKFVKTNFDNDFKLLNDTIDNLCIEMSITELREYMDSRMLINDDTFDSLSKNLTRRIIEILSDEYLELIKAYVDEVEVYVYQKVYFKVLAIVMDRNSSNIKLINSRNRY